VISENTLHTFTYLIL